MQCAESPHIAFFGEALSNVKRQKLGSNRDSNYLGLIRRQSGQSATDAVIISVHYIIQFRFKVLGTIVT